MIAEVIDRRRLIVTVGTGGVGKTTIAAAVGLAAARRGRRVMVLTIDPAQALARALGLATLAAGGEPVPTAALDEAGLTLSGTLDAGMLDQRQAWDAFVRRHAPTAAVATALLANPLYQALSTSFAGSTEYMAIEEMCRLTESGRYDLVVLDTPPAAHALDFLGAPDRLAPLFERGVVAALARPVSAAGALARFVARRLEGATGARTLHDATAFFVALDALVDAAAARAAQAQALLHDPGAAFVLVAGPRDQVLAETNLLAARMSALGAPLAAVVLNRVQPRPPAVDIGDALASTPASARAWLGEAWRDALAAVAAEDAAAARLAAAMPAGVPTVVIPEGDHDVHALIDLAAIADRLVDGAA
ncbi:MAG: ArsA family ATPase [Myxococcales bacterium]|nr:ArsA family ATPase [Myxococcales bacterium]